MATADYSILYGEILLEILAKLGCIKSLVRCTSVCKSWHSIIKDPHFITKHLSNQNNTSSRYLLCAYAITDFQEIRATGEYFPYSIHYDNVEFNEYYKLKFPDKLESGREVHGYVNGLICYSRVNSAGTITMYLWNPAIRKLKILPKFIQNPNFKFGLAIGFGFEPKFKDYKVLKIAYTSETSVVEIYSLSTNSWRLISDCAPGATYIDSGHELAFVNGNVYWRAYHERYLVLFSLDMANGIMKERKLLCSKVGAKLTKQTNFCLGSLGLGRDHLLVVFGLSLHYKWHHNSCYDIGVYDEYMNNVLKIDDFEELDMRSEDEYLMPIGFRNNGEALLQKNFRDYDSCSSIVSYNLETRKATDFGDKFSRRPYYVEPFVESLVLLNDGDARGLTASVIRKIKSKPK